MSGILLTLIAVLTVISWQVAVGGPLLGLDTGTQRAVHELRDWLHSAPLDGVARALAYLGSTVPAIPVLLGAAALASVRERRAGTPRWWLPLPTAAGAAVLIPLLVIPAKIGFARPGPNTIPLTAGQLGWYPSGHTATSAIAYGTAALLVGRTLTAEAGRLLYTGTALGCAGVGAGLVWSDYHWLLDVAASWCLAGLVLIPAVRWVVRTPLRRSPQAERWPIRGGC